MENPKTCPKRNHVYDGAKYQSCPECIKMDRQKPTVPLAGGDTSEQPNPADPARRMKMAAGQTIPLMLEDGNVPVVAWLVCIKGKDVGTDFRVTAGQSFIGRDKANKICIPGDQRISKIKQASLLFDDRTGECVIANGEGQSINRVNNNMLTGPTTLVHGARIELGDSEFVFVKFCNELHKWEYKAGEQK